MVRGNLGIIRQPVCGMGRDIEKMEDKFKLGKPTKIKPKTYACLRDLVVKML